MIGELGLTPMTKVEVVVRGSDGDAVRDLLRAAGARGYTTVSGVSGFGHHGAHEGRLLFNDQAGLVMVITVLPADRAAEAVGGLRQFLDTRAGVMFVSDTYVSRPDYFTLGDDEG